MKKETKKTLKENLKDAGVLFLFLSQILAVGYLLLVKVPNVPAYATGVVALGVAISACITWFRR